MACGPKTAVAWHADLGLRGRMGGGNGAPGLAVAYARAAARRRGVDPGASGGSIDDRTPASAGSASPAPRVYLFEAW